MGRGRDVQVSEISVRSQRYRGGDNKGPCLSHTSLTRQGVGGVREEVGKVGRVIKGWLVRNYCVISCGMVCISCYNEAAIFSAYIASNNIQNKNTFL